MYKKILISSFLCSTFLLVNVGCAKKPDSGDVQANSSVNKEETQQLTNKKENSEETTTAVIGSDVNKNDAQAVLDKIRVEFPKMKVNKLENSPIKGYYQVATDGEVFYIASDAKTMFVGDVIAIDKPQKVNLTENVRRSSREDLIKTIPESDMIVFSPKKDVKTEHTVTVFTDVDCGYCRKFHSEIQSYLDKGIKVRYMAFPRAGIGSDSYKKAVTVWCSKDQQKAMNDAKLTEDFKIDKELCDKKSIIDNSINMVRKLGLNGTPALLLDDGTLIPGYMPVDKLKDALDQERKQQSEAGDNSDHNA